jgi:hypothetical protein
MFVTRPGWLINSFFRTFLIMKNNNLLLQKTLNISEHPLGTGPLLLKQHYGTLLNPEIP